MLAMRHVNYDPGKIKYPDGWHERAEAARKSIKDASADTRSEKVKKYQPLWAELKPILAEVMRGKCWYTEAPQAGAGTDTDVDHFRPKNAVKGVRKNDTNEEHPGYWWRALEPDNFRYSCIVANRPRRDIETGHVGGKVDEFPIWDEKTRAWKPDDDCNAEQPLLIDPCNPAEVALITFAENGEATARHNKSERPRYFAKADCSIKLYHLNHSEFVKARIGIRDKLVKYIEDARRYYKQLDDADANTEHAYMRTIEHLREARNEYSPFSSFAVAFLEPYRLDDSLAPVFY
jgi:hypothetical protein